MARRGSEVTQATRRELWQLSMGMCCLCREVLDASVNGSKPTAMVAHIVALADAGPRADPALPVERRNAVENLLLVCPRCHDLIDKATTIHTVESLREAKVSHETYIAAMWEAASGWSPRFGSIDYVNLPRMAMLPGGEVVQRVAAGAELDDRSPFAEQGLAPGMFVARLRPVLETWSGRAVELDGSTVRSLKEGALVSFELKMRARFLDGSPDSDRFPALTAIVGGRRVAIRLDLKWLTTSTAGENVRTAARETTVFAGLGMVVGTGGPELRLSALLLGQPQPAELARFEFAGNMENAPRDLSPELFEVPEAPVSGGREQAAMTVALHFDEGTLQPGQAEQPTFRQLQRVVPEFRRELSVAVGHLLPPDRPSCSTPYDLAFALLSAEAKPRRTFTATSMASLLQCSHVVFAIVRELSFDQATALHEALTEREPAYRGWVQVVAADDVHRQVYGLRAGYRMVERDLHLLYSPALESAGLEERDLAAVDGWTESGLFDTVDWAVDLELEEAAKAEAESFLDAFYRQREMIAATKRAAAREPSRLTIAREDWFGQVCAEILDLREESVVDLLGEVRADLGAPDLVRAMVFVRARALDGQGLPADRVAEILADSGVFAGRPEPGRLEALVSAARGQTSRTPYPFVTQVAPWDPEELSAMLEERWASTRRSTCDERQVERELREHWGTQDPRVLDYLCRLPVAPLDHYQPLKDWLKTCTDTRLSGCVAACLSTTRVRGALDEWHERLPLGLAAVSHLWELGSDLVQLKEAAWLFGRHLQSPKADQANRELYERAHTFLNDQLRLLVEAFKGLSVTECGLTWPRDEDARFQEDCLDRYLTYSRSYQTRGEYDGVAAQRGAWGSLAWWSVGAYGEGEKSAARNLCGADLLVSVLHLPTGADAAGLGLSVKAAAEGASGEFTIRFDYDLNNAVDACELLLLAKRRRVTVDVLTETEDWQAELLGSVCVPLMPAVASQLATIATDALRGMRSDWTDWIQPDGSESEFDALTTALEKRGAWCSPRFRASESPAQG